MSGTDDRSIPELISAVSADVSQLVREEADLIRSELSERFAVLGRAAVAMGVGVVVVLGAYLCLLAALVLWLSTYMAAGWAALVVGVATGLIGFSLVAGGARKARPEAMRPLRSAENLRRDAQVMKEQVR